MTTSENGMRVSDERNFFQGNRPFELTKTYGSPLYVYNERILRQKCREMKGLVAYPNFKVHYSAKANSNLAVLQIIRSEGLSIDAMTPGEVFAELKAGYTTDQIFYVSNNMSEAEMKYVIEQGILISVDSVAQLEQFGRLNPGSNVAVRFNPGIGAGHHDKTITAGDNTKFGVENTAANISKVKEVCRNHSLTVVGVNMHIGSHFMNTDSYMQSSDNLLEIAKHFDDLSFIDLGGGFGIPYMKQARQQGINLGSLGTKLTEFMYNASEEYGKQLEFRVEPGRYIVAESAVILGKVMDIKQSYGTKYVGTDIGFNVLMRPVMYDSHHDIEVLNQDGGNAEHEETVTVTGNICESGDILARARMLPKMAEGDLICVMDAGAYGHSMSSNYNNRLRPAEVLIRENSEVVVIRERDTMEDLIAKHRPL